MPNDSTTDREIFQNETIVAIIAAHKGMMSTSPAKGLRRPKNRGDHAALSRSWKAKIPSALPPPLNPRFRQTSQAENAIIR